MKHVITLIDGTSRNARVEKVHSNIYRLNLSLRERGHNKKTKRYDEQVVMYYPGVGSSLTKDRMGSYLFGYGIVDLVKDAYVNIASNYYKGDKLYIFGFSRGAVAARILSGFIGNFGLLKPDNIDLLEYAWEYYELISTKEGPHLDFRRWINISYLETVPSDDKIMYMNVHIEFLGLFDPVPGGSNPERSMLRHYKDGGLAPARGVKVAIQLVSIDETRPFFSPLLWNAKHRFAGDVEQHVEQIWMPGVHTDIGGGYRNSFLSNLAFLTMIDKLRQYDSRLKFYEDYIDQIKKETKAINFSYVINDESIIPHFMRVSLLKNIYKYREIKQISNKKFDSYENDIAGIYNSIHPFVFRIRDRAVNYKNKLRRYNPVNIQNIDSDSSFKTRFFNEPDMYRFCGIDDR
jgi:uncharacterized protein (DUF2235 family)